MINLIIDPKTRVHRFRTVKTRMLLTLEHHLKLAEAVIAQMPIDLPDPDPNYGPAPGSGIVLRWTLGTSPGVVAASVKPAAVLLLIRGNVPIIRFYPEQVIDIDRDPALVPEQDLERSFVHRTIDGPFTLHDAWSLIRHRRTHLDLETWERACP